MANRELAPRERINLSEKNVRLVRQVWELKNGALRLLEEKGIPVHVGRVWRAADL